MSRCPERVASRAVLHFSRFAARLPVDAVHMHSVAVGLVAGGLRPIRPLARMLGDGDGVERSWSSLLP